MIEKNRKTVSIRVYEETLESLKDEQHKQRKLGKEEPSYPEIVDAAWRAYESGFQASVRDPTPDGIDRITASLLSQKIDEILAILNRQTELIQFMMGNRDEYQGGSAAEEKQRREDRYREILADPEPVKEVSLSRKRRSGQADQQKRKSGS